MTESRIRLFVYGTLLDEKIQQQVFARCPERVPAVLSGWSVRPRSVRGLYPDIVRRAGASTSGAVLKIDRAELERADRYEDAPVLYRRLRVTVLAGDRRERCWMYVATVAGAPADGRGLSGQRADRRES